MIVTKRVVPLFVVAGFEEFARDEFGIESARVEDVEGAERRGNEVVNVIAGVEEEDWSGSGNRWNVEVGEGRIGDDEGIGNVNRETMVEEREGVGKLRKRREVEGIGRFRFEGKNSIRNCLNEAE